MASTAIISKNKKGLRKTKLDHYAGRWVAFLGESIIASAGNLKDLMMEIDAKGLRGKVSVFLVPRKDEGPYILAVL